MANAPSENPIVSPTLGVAHHGAFHAVYLVQSLDALVLAMAQSASSAWPGSPCSPSRRTPGSIRSSATALQRHRA